MKELKNYLSFRCYRTILPSIVLVALYAIICLGGFSYDKQTLQYITFASARGENLCFGFQCVVGMLLLLNLVIMIRDYRNAKTRLCLLPQKRTAILWLDILWLFILLLLMCGLLYFFYQRDFYRFVALLDEKQVHGDAQIRSLAYALHSQPLTAHLFPYASVLLLQNLVVLWGIAMLVPVLSTFFLFDEQLTKRKWCSYGVFLIVYVLLAIHLHEVFATLWLCFLIYVLLKQACICWSAV